MANDSFVTVEKQVGTIQVSAFRKYFVKRIAIYGEIWYDRDAMTAVKNEAVTYTAFS